jgi:hypothetical protein
MRAFRRRAAGWRRRARRAAFAALLAAGVSGTASVAQAQIGGMGQGAMAPSGGVLNRAVTRLSDLNQNGPGWMYFGLNPADRGLGYNGGYMTLGGFIPYAEDDLGGFWAADLRGHLSEYGGFFSNVGAVRKQFLGGTLLGVGVYWDYDGDQNQYPTGGACGTSSFGQFGHSYNQVGVSGEWLTDYGNLRSNGYIPVGRTANTAGNPGSVFYQNYVMAQYGLDAALTGADLEVGAYVPGLSDWAGMISVGGYALGNSRYDWSQGSLIGQDVVPWFGGVYTRLDMTFLENWDFSIQYNNDSYFDSTGFIRLTYRMGGSRRRNVPDQVEQPMMRNEHIVRAHQTPIVAVNPVTDEPWRVVHVNNIAAAGGNGTAASPFTTIEAANAAATNPYDIVFVAAGSGVYNQAAAFTPLAPNQYFVGDGANFCVASCYGPINIATGATRPTISNPSGASVVLDGGLTTANFIVQGSRVGVQAGSGLLVGDTATVANYQILASGSGPQTGIELLNTGGNVNVTNTLVQNMTDVGLRVNGIDPVSNQAPNLVFQGSLLNSGTAGGGTSPIIEIKDTLGGGGGDIKIAAGPTPAFYKAGDCPEGVRTTVANSISDTGGGGVVVENSDSNIVIDNITLATTQGTAVSVIQSGGSVKIGENGPATITNPTNGAILVQGGNPEFVYKGSITNNAGNAVKVDSTVGGSVTVTNPSGTSTETGLGLLVQNSAGDVLIEKFKVDSQQAGLLVQNNTFSGATGGVFRNLTITGTSASAPGVSLSNNTGPMAFQNIVVSTNAATGFLGVNNEQITMTGANSVTTTGAAALSVTNDASITDSTTLLFTSLSSTNSTSNGVLLSGVDGSLDVTGTGITVTNPAGVGVLIRDTQTGLAVNVPGTVSVTGTAPGGGISLINVNDGINETVLFNSINLQTTGGTGLLVTNAPTAFNNGLVQINGGTIASTGGPALSALNANLDISLASVTSTDSTTTGISLVDSNNSFSAYPGVTIASTTVTRAATSGIFLRNNIPQLAGGGVFADFGTASITNAGQFGIFAQNTNAAFTGATIATSGVNAVQLVANSGEETTFLLQNSTLNGAGGVGVNISANSGTVNATVATNRITVTGNSIAATTSGAGAVAALNATGNSGVAAVAPTGGIVLTNTAGNTLAVSQQAPPQPAPPGPYTALENAIKADNNGAAVTITNPVGGTLLENQTVPLP